MTTPQTNEMMKEHCKTCESHDGVCMWCEEYMQAICVVCLEKEKDVAITAERERILKILEKEWRRIYNDTELQTFKEQILSGDGK